MLKIIGGIAMNLMVPVLSAYIAESIGKRPALVPRLCRRYDRHPGPAR